MQRVNVISRDNGAGLSRHIAILRDVLSRAGVEVTVSRISAPPLSNGVQRAAVKSVRLIGNHLNAIRKRTGSRRFDANLFIEAIYPEWLPCARTNCLLPNQEWFRDEYLRWLPEIDLTLCPTKYAAGIFEAMGCAVEYISFTSLDRYSPVRARPGMGILHTAGNSREKGTQAVLDVWSRHPEWPTLYVLRRHSEIRRLPLPNVLYVSRFLTDAQLRRLQNLCAVHLCPSEVEAFGHTIVEGMSAKALTIVTDAPPMNEIAGADRSLFVGYTRTQPMRLGTRYFADPGSIETAIDEALQMDRSARASMGERAREWFLENDAFFRKRVVEVIAGI